MHFSIIIIVIIIILQKTGNVRMVGLHVVVIIAVYLDGQCVMVEITAGTVVMK